MSEKSLTTEEQELMESAHLLHQRLTRDLYVLRMAMACRNKPGAPRRAFNAASRIKAALTEWVRNNGERGQVGNLEDHARRELERLGEEPETIDWYCRVIREFVSAGHSGGSASVAIPTLNQLLQFKALTPLTDDPDEWQNVSEFSPSGPALWQNMRNPEAFSNDGGATYYLLSERDAAGGSLDVTPRHTSSGRVGRV